MVGGKGGLDASRLSTRLLDAYSAWTPCRVTDRPPRSLESNETQTDLWSQTTTTSHRLFIPLRASLSSSSNSRGVFPPIIVVQRQPCPIFPLVSHLPTCAFPSHFGPLLPQRRGGSPWTPSPCSPRFPSTVPGVRLRQRPARGSASSRPWAPYTRATSTSVSVASFVLGAAEMQVSFFWPR